MIAETTHAIKHKSLGDMEISRVQSIQCFTFEVNDTNSRPSTSSSSGCIATVNDGLSNTVGGAATAFHSLPREFAQRLFILFFLLRSPVEELGLGVKEVGVIAIGLGFS